MWLDFSTSLVTIRPLCEQGLIVSARKVTVAGNDGRRAKLSFLTEPPFSGSYAIRPIGEATYKIERFAQMWYFEIERYGQPFFMQFGRLCDDWIVEIREGRESTIPPHLRLVLDNYDPNFVPYEAETRRSVWARLDDEI